MERCDQRSKRCKSGGIVSLAKFCEEHSGALSYDLLTRTNYQLDDVGGTLSWSSLYSFIKNLKSDSALARDLGRSTGWEDTLQTNILLADIYDLLQVINANLMRLGGNKRKHIKPYPRPGKDEDNERKIGKGAMPVNDLREWFRRKRNG